MPGKKTAVKTKRNDNKVRGFSAAEKEAVRRNTGGLLGKALKAAKKRDDHLKSL